MALRAACSGIKIQDHTHTPCGWTTHRGDTADSHEVKAKMLVDIPSVPPTPFKGDEGHKGPLGLGTKYLAIDEHLVSRAFRRTSSKKVRGPDGISPLAIECIYDWEPSRVVALIRAHIRLDSHPDKWKRARRVKIPKPGKDDNT